MRRLSLLAVVAIAVAVASHSAGAVAPATAGVALDRTSARPGERVVVTLEGFDAPAGTLSVCGNLAKRGSGDCNLVASQGIGLNPSGPTRYELVVSLPPVPCPCVVRASTADQAEVATAPVDIEGAPEAPVVDPTQDAPIRVEVLTRRADRDPLARLRTSLAGPTDYIVTVAVTNVTDRRLDQLVLRGTAGRGDDRSGPSLRLPRPVPLGPGESAVYEARATVAPPALGRSEWRVVASTEGRSAIGVATSTSSPTALAVVVVVLVADVTLWTWRRLARRRREQGRRPRAWRRVATTGR